MKPKNKASEHQIQAGIVRYLRLRRLLFCAVPNERTPSKGNYKAYLLKLWSRGMEPGAPDLIVFEPRGSYHGLAIECKSATGRLQESQSVFLSELERRGYKTMVHNAVDDAVTQIEVYLNETNAL